MSRLTNLDIMKHQASDLVADGGLMPADYRTQFFVDLFNSTELLKSARTEIVNGKKLNLDKYSVAGRVARGRLTENEDVSSHMVSGTFGQLALSLEEVILPWSISKRALLQAINQGNLEQTIEQAMRKQFSVDLQDLALNGDTITPPDCTLAADIADGAADVDITVDDVTGYPRLCEAGWLKIDDEYFKYTSVDTSLNKFLGCQRAQNGTATASHDGTGSPATVEWVAHPLTGTNDGWLKTIEASGNVVDLSEITPTGGSAGDICLESFFTMQKALPSKYQRNGSLAWIISPAQYTLYSQFVANRSTGGGDQAANGIVIDPLGHRVIVCAEIPDDTIILTDPQNLVFAVNDEIEYDRTDQGLNAVIKKEVYSTLDIYADFGVQWPEAAVVGYQLATS